MFDPFQDEEDELYLHNSHGNGNYDNHNSQISENEDSSDVDNDIMNQIHSSSFLNGRKQYHLPN